MERSRVNGPPNAFASRALIGWNLKTCQTEINRLLTSHDAKSKIPNNIGISTGSCGACWVKNWGISEPADLCFPYVKACLCSTSWYTRSSLDNTTLNMWLVWNFASVVVNDHDIYTSLWVIFLLRESIPPKYSWLENVCEIYGRSKVIAGKFKLGLEPMQRNISNNNSHVSIAFTLNFDVKTLASFERS